MKPFRYLRQRKDRFYQRLPTLRRRRKRTISCGRWTPCWHLPLAAVGSAVLLWGEYVFGAEL
jgi:hypothetical protein